MRLFVAALLSFLAASCGGDDAASSSHGLHVEPCAPLLEDKAARDDVLRQCNQELDYLYTDELRLDPIRSCKPAYWQYAGDRKEKLDQCAAQRGACVEMDGRRTMLDLAACFYDLIEVFEKTPMMDDLECQHVSQHCFRENPL